MQNSKCEICRNFGALNQTVTVLKLPDKFVCFKPSVCQLYWMTTCSDCCQYTMLKMIKLFFILIRKSLCFINDLAEHLRSLSNYFTSEWNWDTEDGYNSFSNSIKILWFFLIVANFLHFLIFLDYLVTSSTIYFIHAELTMLTIKWTLISIIKKGFNCQINGFLEW